MRGSRPAAVAAWWSLPVGAVEGARVARATALHSSLYASGIQLRPLAAGAIVVLFYAAAFAAAAWLLGRILGTAGDRHRGAAQAAAVILAGLPVGMAACLLASGPLAVRPTTVAVLAAAGILGAGSLLVRWGWGPSRSRLAGSTACGLAAGLVGLPSLLVGGGGVAPSAAAVALVAGSLVLLTAAAWGRWLPGVALGAAVAALAIAGSVAPDVPPAPRTANGGTPVVLVTVDTLRADALSAPGVEPAGGLQRLRRDGILFPRAYAPAPWTIPSVYAMLTSRLPHELGLTGGRTPRLPEGQPSLPDFLPPGVPSRAVVTNVFGSSAWGDLRGWDSVESADLSSPPLDALLRGLVLPRLLLGLRPLRYRWTEARAEPVTVRAIRHLDALGGGPFLLWVHYYDPHSPYDPPPPYDAAATAHPTRLHRIRTRSPAYLRQGGWIDPADRAHLRALYDGEVAYLDAWLARLWDAMEARGLWDRSLVLLASDHGEEFWEHGSVEHGHTLYEELVRVPLLVKLPGGELAGSVHQRPVGLLDLLPTVVDQLGGPPSPDGSIRGASLLPFLRGGSAEPRSLYFEGLAHGGERKAIQQWPWKLILDLPRGREELYRLDEDPGETWSRAPLEPDLVERLRAAVAPFVAADRAASRDEVPAAVRDRLRALGYVQ